MSNGCGQHAGVSNAWSTCQMGCVGHALCKSELLFTLQHQYFEVRNIAI